MEPSQSRARAMRRIAAGFGGLLIGALGLFGYRLGTRGAEWLQVCMVGFAIGSIGVIVGALELSPIPGWVEAAPPWAKRVVPFVVILAVLALVAWTVWDFVTLF